MSGSGLPNTAVKPRRLNRQSWLVVIGVAIALSIWSAGADPTELFNPRGWSQVQSFFSAMVRPDVSREMLALTARESAVTIGYALVGTALALVIGSIGGVLLTERLWSPQSGVIGIGRLGWFVGRLAFAVPRSMHEVVFGLILVNILGLNPLVAVLAIGVPFGAVTAKVFSELLDDVPKGAEQNLRASGAGRLTALLFATVPQAFSDLLSYAFYRFECSLRSAAVLGIVGAGGLGFQLALSFQSLRYEEMWTFLWALIILSGVADRWSSLVRRRRNALAAETRTAVRIDPVAEQGPNTSASDELQIRPRGDRFLQFSALLCTVSVPVAIWGLNLDISTLWAPRAAMLTERLVADAWPPQIGEGGVNELLVDSLDTVALAVLSIALAVAIGSPLAFMAKRPTSGFNSARLRWAVSILVRFLMLISRAVPPPVWAFVVVFVLFPGLWPGAVALGIYNAGILGRLQAEVVENNDQRPAQTLAAMGASASGKLLYATMPAVAGRFAGLSLYRWEVAIRETVIVGVVGAAGLGRRLDEQTSSFNYDGVLATILTLLVVTVAVDIMSASIRRSLR